MKKLVLLLLAFAPYVFAMEKPKQKYTDTQTSKIKCNDPYFDERQELYVIEAKEDSTLCGIVTFKYNPSNKNLGHIYSLNVNPEYREKGIGSQLFKQAVLELKKQGYQKITWMIWNPDEENMPRTLLKKISTKMVQKLSTEVACNLEIGPWELDPRETYCTLTLL